MKIIVLGSPGAGKGTYAQELVRRVGFRQISTGDMFRELIKENHPLGLQAKEYMEKGDLVPDSLVINMFKEYFRKNDIKDNFILDGFPRTIPQAKALEEFMSIDRVLNFTTKREIIIERLSGRLTCKKCKAIFHKTFIKPKVQGVCDYCSGELTQRPDDMPNAIEERLRVYEEKTAPLIEYYDKKHQLKTLRIDDEFNPNKENIMGRIFDGLGIDYVK